MICFLIADKDVKGLFLLRNGEDTLLNIIDGLCFLFVKLALITVCVLNGGFVVIVVEDRRKLGAVDRRHALVRRRILHVFDAVLTKHQRPIRLGVGSVLVENLLIHSGRLVEVVVPAEMICPVVKVCSAIIVKARQRLLRPA